MTTKNSTSAKKAYIAVGVAAYLAGTAAGLGVFAQMFIGAVFVQFYATIADGTPIPMVITTAIATVLTLITGIIPFALRSRRYSAVGG